VEIPQEFVILISASGTDPHHQTSTNIFTGSAKEVSHPVLQAKRNQESDQSPSRFSAIHLKNECQQIKPNLQAMALDFSDKDGPNTHDPNIDASLSLNPPTGLASPSSFDTTAPPALTNLENSQGMTDQSFGILTEDPSASLPQEQPLQQPLQSYTPAKLFQATGDVRNLARSQSTPSGFTVQIYDRHTRNWVPDIDFSDIAIRGQIYILWKTSWLENAVPPTPIDREMVLDAASLTLRDIHKDNNKWERNYSAARRRDWHPHFTTFYDDVFKGLWAHRVWPTLETLPEPPRFLAEMARKLTKNAGVGAGTNIHQSTPVGGQPDGEMSMSPVALRILKLRVIELEGICQGLREELGIHLSRCFC
jgi:hypothetical protein